MMRRLLSRPFRSPRQRGAALLTAMVIVTLVATLSAAMMWRQWRAVQIEAAERSRAQSAWMLSGALDWARLILREDARNGGPDHLGEPWAVPLAEARLSTFLAADRDNTEDAPEAFLSGAIEDLQSRFNLNNLRHPDTNIFSRHLGVLQRLTDQLGLEAGLAKQLADEIRRAAPAPSASEGETAPSGSGSDDAALLPPRIEDLHWLGLDAATLAALAPHVTLLPRETRINLNTASREVIAAAIEGLDLATAERLVQQRQLRPFRDLAQVGELLENSVQLNDQLVDTKTAFFEVRGRMRIEERVLEERSLVQRRGPDVVVLRRERINLPADRLLHRP